MRVGPHATLTATAAVAILTACGGGEGSGPVTPPTPDAPRATQITISPSSGALEFLGETINFTATVRDQNGSVMTVTITWTSSNTAAVIISSSGSATALANGTATITASTSGLSTTATVTVLQVATQLLIVSGDGQAGPVGETLPDALIVQASDGGGTAMEGINVAFSPTGAGTVSDQAVTSDSQGRASTTWTLGTDVAVGQQVTAVMGENTVQVVFNATPSPGAPVAFRKISGDEQLGVRGTALGDPLVVSVTDAFDNPVPSVDVTFAVTGGGGAVDTSDAQTDPTGEAGTIWTLGDTPGANTATATTTGFTALEFTATGVGVRDLTVTSVSISPATPTQEQTVTFSAIIQNNGDDPNVIDVPVAFSVDNMRLGTAQTGTVAPGGGQVTVDFQAGPFSSGSHSFSVEVDPDGELAETDETNNSKQGIFQVIEATALTDGVPVANLAGDQGSLTYFVFEVGGSGGQAPAPSVAGYQGPVAASVRRGGGTQKYSPVGYLERPGALSPALAARFITALQIDLTGGSEGEDADLYVKFGSQPTTSDFDFLSAGSTNTEALTISSPQSGSWHILVHGFTAYAGVTLTASVGEAQQGSEFDIELVFLSAATTSQLAAFEAARVRWEAAITGDVPDVNFGSSPVAADDCVTDQPEITDVVDDVRIFVRFIPIDGEFGVLARAGPCFTLNTSNLPVLGFMEFDTDDLDFLESRNLLTSVVLHEMGHVLGIGSLWGENLLNLIAEPSLPNSAGADTHFTGTQAIAAFDAAGGTAYTGGQKVPVENQAEDGSSDSHWRESVLGNELMTPSLDSGSNPLSAITLASLTDMGYTVNLAAADEYALNLGLGAVDGTQSKLHFGNDIVRRPIIVVDTHGRVVRVIHHE